MKNIEKRKVKILFCTGSFITGAGGVASYAHDFIDAFPQCQFVVLTQDDYRKTDEVYGILKIDMEDWSIDNALRLLNLIDEIKPDIVVNSYCKLLALVTPYISDSVRVVSVSHFTDGGYAWAAGMNGNYSDEIVTLSKYAKEYLGHKFHIKDKGKIHVIYNFMPSLLKQEVEAKKNRKVLKIIYPGGHSWQKSAEIVAHAVQKLCKTSLPFEFYWLGNIDLPGSKWPLAKTKTVKDCLPMNDNRIKHVGRVERTLSKELISNANIFLLPSRGEGCPITLLEAMRAGCIPIISNVKHGSLDIIRNKELGFVVRQNSVKDLVVKLEDVLQHHSDYKNIYDNTVNEFEQKLSYKCWKAQMEKLLNSELNHITRMKFNAKKYKADVRYLKMLYFFDYLRDRFVRQLYHVFYFRFLHFRKNICFDKHKRQ